MPLFDNSSPLLHRNVLQFLSSDYLMKFKATKCTVVKGNILLEYELDFSSLCSQHILRDLASP